MQKENEVVSKNVAEIRLYSNLIIMMPDENSAKAMAGMIPDFIATIDASLASMHSLAEKLNDKALLDALVIYEDKTHVLEENITTTANSFLAGNKAAAATSHGAMRDIVTELQQYQDTYTQLLAKSAAADAEYGLKFVGKSV